MALTTKRALAASLKKLLEKKTLDHITVKDIVENCEVNRQTFYYHFQDIYDLMEWVFWDDMNHLLPQEGEKINWRMGLTKAVEYMQDNKNLAMNTYHSFSREQLDRYITIAVMPFIRDITVSLSSGLNISQEDIEFATELYSYALAGVLLAWVGKGMPENYEKQVDKFCSVADASIRATLGTFDRRD